MRVTAACNYSTYLSPSELEAGLESATVLRGRIKFTGSTSASVQCPALRQPLTITCREHINRALPGDLVAVQILPKTQWQKVVRDEQAFSYYENAEDQTNTERKDVMMPTARVVGILERGKNELLGSFCARGASEIEEAEGGKYVVFHPFERYFPLFFVMSREKLSPSHAYRVSVDSWPAGSNCPLGTMISDEGNVSGIENATKNILAASSFFETDFSTEITDALPTLPWAGPSVADAASRRDLRSEEDTVVMTIDPATARDLDDAISVRVLNGKLTDAPTPDTVYEVGVHIADVTHFFAKDSELDKRAAQQSVTVYMVQRAVHLLPRVLCEDLCSLNPCEDRLAFSTMWRMDGRGNMLAGDIFVGRTVIHSAARFAYEGAQECLDTMTVNHPGLDTTDTVCGNQVKPGWGKRVVGGLHHLASLARIIRDQRTQRGPLLMSDSKMEFGLDQTRSQPLNVHPHETHDTNKLVEEFMIYANQLTALRLVASFPTCALVRKHAGPEVDAFRKQLQMMAPGVKMQFNNGVEIMNTISEVSKAVNGDAELARRGVQLMFMQSALSAAKYTISCESDVADAWSHYGIASQLYFHFTSPIRRYPDQLLHRLLQAAIDCERDQCGYNAGWTRPEDLPPGAPSPATAPSHSGEPGRTPLRPQCLTWPTTQPFYATWPRELLPPAEVVRSAYELYSAEGLSDAENALGQLLMSEGGGRKANRRNDVFETTVVVNSRELTEEDCTIRANTVSVTAKNTETETEDEVSKLMSACNEDLAKFGFGDAHQLAQMLENCNTRHDDAKKADSSSRQVWLHRFITLACVDAGIIKHPDQFDLPSKPSDGRARFTDAGCVRVTPPLPHSPPSVLGGARALATVTQISDNGEISVYVPELEISYRIDLAKSFYVSKMNFAFPAGDPAGGKWPTSFTGDFGFTANAIEGCTDSNDAGLCGSIVVRNLDISRPAFTSTQQLLGYNVVLSHATPAVDAAVAYARSHPDYENEDAFVPLCEAAVKELHVNQVITPEGEFEESVEIRTSNNGTDDNASGILNCCIEGTMSTLGSDATPVSGALVLGSQFEVIIEPRLGGNALVPEISVRLVPESFARALKDKAAPATAAKAGAKVSDVAAKRAARRAAAGK